MHNNDLFFERKEKEFKQSNPDCLLIDFDDMLTIGNRALEEDEVLLAKYQQRYESPVVTHFALIGKKSVRQAV